MITLLNKFIRRFSSKVKECARLSGDTPLPSSGRLKNNFFTRTRSHRGQVAVILILIIAMGLVFYAVVLNLGRVSQVKTLTLISAETTAGQLASFMASYGQKIFMESLGGKRKVCGWTALFSALIMVTIIIIIIIIIIVSWGAATPAALALATGMSVAMATVVLVGLALALAMAIVNVALTAAVVEPGITEMWNRITGDTMDITDTFVERGVQSALSSIVTDQMKIPDIVDTDSDTIFGFTDPATPLRGGRDNISRYGFLYTQRLIKNAPTRAESQAIIDFQDALRDFLYKDANANDWGIYDPVTCGNSCPANIPAELNHCCQPATMPNPSCQPPGAVDLPPCCSTSPSRDVALPVCDNQAVRPACCGPEDGNPNGGTCGDADNCATSTPYQAVGSEYPYIYESYADDPLNAFLSFRELIGRDDEHHLYRVDEATSFDPPYPNPAVRREVLGSGLAPVPLRDPAAAPASPNAESFNLSDTGGFYSPDIRSGIYPFFYKVADLGLLMADGTFSYTDSAAPIQGTVYPRHCHWCDTDNPTLDASCAPGFQPALSGEVPPALALPGSVILGNPTPTVTGYSGGWCVDNENSLAGPPQLLDKVTGINAILAPLNGCAQWDPAAFGWKRGSDRFCSDTFPYYINCPKHGGATPQCQETYDHDGDPATAEITIDIACGCGDANAGPNSMWPDDKLDTFLAGSTDFIAWAKRIADAPVGTLISTFSDWYPDAAYWIEPLCPSSHWVGCPNVNPNICPPQFYCSGCLTNDPALCPPECEEDPCPGSFTNKVRDGNLNGQVEEGQGEEDWSLLAQTRVDLSGFNNPIRNWITAVALGGPTTQYVGASCQSPGPNDVDSVWCVPPATAGPPNRYGLNECGCVSLAEQATFDVNQNSVRGDLEDVVACLDYNVNDADAYQDAAGNPVQAIGNYNKFRLCEEACADANPNNDDINCANLPRSLVPGFCALGYVSANPAAQATLQNCLASTDLASCNTNCPAAAPFVSTAAFVAPNMANFNSAAACVPQCADGNTCTATCDGIPNVVCNSLYSTRSDFDNASCAFLGGCCNFPAAGGGQNLFYDKIMNIYYGICGADWAMVYSNNFGMGNPFIVQMYKAQGSCYELGSVGVNPFVTAVDWAVNNVATPCVFPQVDGVDCDQTDQNRLNACLADIAVGCVTTACQDIAPGSPTALTNNHSGDPYNIPPFEVGVMGNGCDDTPVFNAMEQCATSCSEANCWATTFGGNMPTRACDGTPLGLAPNPAVGAGALTPLEKTNIESCLADCQANAAACAWVDANFGWGLFAMPDALGQAQFNAQCGNQANCVANAFDCDNLAYQLPNAQVYTFLCNAPTAYNSPLEVCAASNTNSCSWWAEQPGGTVLGALSADPSDSPIWHDEAQTAATSAAISGSCAETIAINPVGFRALLAQSVRESEVQVEKMRKRLGYLKDLLQDGLNIAYRPSNLNPDNPYLPEGAFPQADDQDLSDPRFVNFASPPASALAVPPPNGGVLSEGIVNFSRFLDNGTPWYAGFGQPCNSPRWPCRDPAQPYNKDTNRRIQDSPVERLIDARRMKDVEPSLPAAAVYVWKDADKPYSTRRGLWHAVKAEVRTPRRCLNECGITENGQIGGLNDPQWPRVRTYTRSWGLERCYELVDTTGMVKVRVVRWDEDRDSVFDLLRFPDNSPIWKIRTSHPTRGSGSADASKLLDPTVVDPPGINCLDQVDGHFVEFFSDPACPGCLYDWAHAFMLNTLPKYTSSLEADVRYANCWNHVHTLLQRGVRSEACAMYYYNDGMQVRFVECDPKFRQGLN